MPEDNIIESKEEWEWYCKRLDVEQKYTHLHKGIPERYPCKVESELGDDPNGPYFYRHRFFYQQEQKCAACGHSELVWPKLS